YLISGLSKKNYKPSVSELHQLISLHGYDAQVFFLRTLIEEIQVQDAKQSNSGGRDQLKLQLLQSELQRLEQEEQFGILFYQAIEASRDGSPLVTDDLVTQLCRVTKVSLKSQLALSV
ncbi:unnamed protein product, partial [Polarella glacialis]